MMTWSLQEMYTNFYNILNFPGYNVPFIMIFFRQDLFFSTNFLLEFIFCLFWKYKKKFNMLPWSEWLIPCHTQSVAGFQILIVDVINSSHGLIIVVIYVDILSCWSLTSCQIRRYIWWCFTHNNSIWRNGA